MSLWSIAVHLPAGHLIAEQGRTTGMVILPTTERCTPITGCVRTRAGRQRQQDWQDEQDYGMKRRSQGCHPTGRRRRGIGGWRRQEADTSPERVGLPALVKMMVEVAGWPVGAVSRPRPPLAYRHSESHLAGRVALWRVLLQASEARRMCAHDANGSHRRFCSTSSRRNAFAWPSRKP